MSQFCEATRVLSRDVGGLWMTGSSVLSPPERKRLKRSEFLNAYDSDWEWPQRAAIEQRRRPNGCVNDGVVNEFVIQLLATGRTAPVLQIRKVRIRPRSEAEPWIPLCNARH